MLTCDYDRLGLVRGDLLLDLGCGFGRHAYEAARRGADVIALDAGGDEVRGVAATFAAMAAAGELDDESSRVGTVQGDAFRLPFADATFDRVICSEVLEHLPDDRHRDGRARPGAAPRRDDGRDGAALRPRARELGPVRRVPRGAGRPHPHLPPPTAARAAALERPRGDGDRARARPAQPLLVAALRGRHHQRGPRHGPRLPPALGEGHRRGPALDAVRRPDALAGHRQVDRRLPAPAGLGARGRRPRAAASRR